MQKNTITGVEGELVLLNGDAVKNTRRGCSSKKGNKVSHYCVDFPIHLQVEYAKNKPDLFAFLKIIKMCTENYCRISRSLDRLAAHFCKACV